MKSYVLTGAPLAAVALGGVLLVSEYNEARYGAGRCVAVDGDTLRCGKERIRLVEMDAPEMPGHCRKGRVCAPGDPYASKANLAALVLQHRITLRRYGKDRYGRTLADARVKSVSLSCLQINGGYAIQQLKWGDYGVTTRECP